MSVAVGFDCSGVRDPAYLVTLAEEAAERRRAEAKAREWTNDTELLAQLVEWTSAVRSTVLATAGVKDIPDVHHVRRPGEDDRKEVRAVTHREMAKMIRAAVR